MSEFLSTEERERLDQQAVGAPQLRVVRSNETESETPAFPMLGELDAARFFAREYGDRIRHCAKAGGWLLWDGSRWKLDDDGAIYRLAGERTDAIADLAGTIPDLEDRKKVLTFAINLRKRRGLENLIALAATLDGIAIGNPERFDADQWLLNVANGTIDLRTGELRPHDRNDLLTNRASRHVAFRHLRSPRFSTVSWAGRAATLRSSWPTRR